MTPCRALRTWSGCGGATKWVGAVRRYLRQSGCEPYGQHRLRRRLDEQLVWLRVQFEKHQGNGEVMRQELLRQGIRVSQRTVERLVEP